MQALSFVYLCFENSRMGRILGVDYGLKRCGLAVTDPLGIIVNGLETVDAEELVPFILQYHQLNPIGQIVVGWPTHRDGSETYLGEHIQAFVREIKNSLPDIDVELFTERFTSSEAKQILIKIGTPKEKRKNKALVDKLSAVLILQHYLGHY